LNAQEHRLTLANGDEVHYDRALLATGGRPFSPPIRGADRKGIFTLRTFEDAQAIKEHASHSRNVIVIGGGLLGLETARAILTPQTRVSVLEFMPHLLPRQLCAMGAAVLQHQLEKMGLHILTSAVTDEILGDGRVSGVRLKDGHVVEGQTVVVSAGIRSRTELAQGAGIEVQRGIVVDEHLRTSAPDVYAAGDAAEFQGIVYGIIPAAIEQARAAAANMVADGAESVPRAVYKGTIPSTTLKVVGIDLACLGNSTAIADGTFTVVGKKDESAGMFKKLVLQDGKISGAVLLGDTRDARTLQQLIEKGVDVSAYESRLLDPGFDLAELGRSRL
jgi:nitrite reductase (NADH) large subunit